MGAVAMHLPSEEQVKSGLQLQPPPLKFPSKMNRLSQKFLTACSGGNIPLARACLRSGKVDINYCDGTATPLTAALASSSHVLVQLLMDQHGLDVNKPACNMDTLALSLLGRGHQGNSQLRGALASQHSEQRGRRGRDPHYVGCVGGQH